MEIFKLFGSIFVDTDKADKSIQKTEGFASKLGKGFVEVVKKGAKVAAGVGAIATAAGVAITSVAENTREYRNEMAKLDTAFQDAEHSNKAARDTYKSLQKLLGETDQAVEAANHLAELCDTEERLATWTDICTGVYAKFGVSLPIEGLTEAANETAKTGALTGALADALNWAGVKEDAFQEALDKCNNEQERQVLITDTLNGLYKDSAELYKENNKTVLDANAAQERLNEAIALAGEKLEPVVTGIKNFGAALLEKAIPAVVDFATESDVVQLILEALEDTTNLLNDACEGLKNIINDISDAWEDSVKWGKEHESVLTLITIAVGTLTAALIAHNSAKIIKKALDIGETIAIYGLIAAENAHTIATTVATAATSAFGAVLSFITSPITLVILAIGALVAAGIALYKNWDVVKEKAIELWTKVTDTFEKMKLAVSVIISALSFYFTEKIESMKTKATEVFDGIKKAIEEKIQAAKDFVGDCIEKIKGFFDFEWRLPELKMPHFSISGEFSLNPLQVPSIGVDWYKKAMNQPMILDEATIFGINKEGEPMGAGEAGSEVVSGTNTLLNMISTVVASQNEALIAVLYMILEAIVRMDQNMGGNLREALEGMSWKINDREVARWIRGVLA